jgi:hypothetical protein
VSALRKAIYRLGGAYERLTSEHKLDAIIFYAENDAYPDWYFGSNKRRQMTQGADRSGQFAVPMNTMGSPNNEKMLTETLAGSRSASRTT